MNLFPDPHCITQAREVAACHRLSPPVDVFSLARSLGISIQFVPLFAAAGILMPAGPEKHEIIVDSWTRSARRIRFTIAHELGHYFLHAQGREEYSCTVYRGQIEREANAFAAELLMPEEQVRLLVKTARSIEELADRFEVSRQAMTYRLKDLELEGLTFLENARRFSRSH